MRIRFIIAAVAATLVAGCIEDKEKATAPSEPAKTSSSIAADLYDYQAPVPAPTPPPVARPAPPPEPVVVALPPPEPTPPPPPQPEPVAFEDPAPALRA